MARPKVDGIGVKLDSPFNNAAAGFLVAEDVSERVLCDDRYVVGVEVVVELLGCNKDGIQ